MEAWGTCEQDVVVSGSRMESSVVAFPHRGGSANEEAVSVSGGEGAEKPLSGERRGSWGTRASSTVEESFYLVKFSYGAGYASRTL